MKSIRIIDNTTPATGLTAGLARIFRANEKEGDYECRGAQPTRPGPEGNKVAGRRVIHNHLDHRPTSPDSGEVGKKQLREVATMLKRYVD